MVSLRTGKPIFGFLMGILSPSLQGRRWILVNACPQFRAREKRPFQVYTTFEDITDRYAMFTGKGGEDHGQERRI